MKFRNFFRGEKQFQIPNGVAINTTILNLYLSRDQGPWLKTKSKILRNWAWVLLGPEILGERRGVSTMAFAIQNRQYLLNEAV